MGAAAVGAITADSPQAIIRAEKIEKYYAQPSENRIQVISATDLVLSRVRLWRCLGLLVRASRRCSGC